MADYYVDSNSGDNGDTGLTQALAWATIEYAVESGGIVAGDIVWVRRTHIEYGVDPTSDITLPSSGNRNSFKSIIGWPRAAIANTVITSATWVNGSTTVDLVVGATLSRGAHCGRWITAPNGKKFLITQITDTNTLIIDREYSGTGVSGANGKFQIEADEDHSSKPADVDGWDSDAIALPVIDFRNTSYRISGSSINYWTWKNLEIRDSAYVLSAFYTGISIVVGCLFHQDNDARICYINGGYADRCIFEGSVAGASQYGVTFTGVLKNAAIYNCGAGGLVSARGFLENVNIGVESVNGAADIFVYDKGHLSGRDVKCGSTTPFDLSYPQYSYYNVSSVRIENYQKVLGNHKVFFATQTFTSKDVVAGSGDPYKRSGGTDKIIEASCQDSDGASVPERAVIVFEHEFETDTTSKSYRYYVNCKDLSLTASELWLEVEYVDSYDDTSEYTITKEESDETCALRGSVSDWTQYIEVTGIAPAVASKVRIKCFVAKYDADGYIYIDPKVVIT